MHGGFSAFELIMTSRKPRGKVCILLKCYACEAACDRMHATFEFPGSRITLSFLSTNNLGINRKHAIGD
jgi:hypothetical protein